MLTAAGPERARPEVSRRGQVLFEHAVYGEEGTNLRQLRKAADCLTLCAAANGCFTGALTDRRVTSVKSTMVKTARSQRAKTFALSASRSPSPWRTALHATHWKLHSNRRAWRRLYGCLRH